MAAALRHRGPDGYGFLVDPCIGLAHTRLSIIDLSRGHQPLSNEDGRLWVTYNGEIYNYRELRLDLETRGHRFRTATDTEVIVHAWEEWGPAMLEQFNGQFAFALYDRLEQSVFLARDRFGVRPLFYAQRGGDLFFASEAKALFAAGEIDARADPVGLAELTTFWATRGSRTVFRGVHQLEAGGWASWRKGRLETGIWFRPQWEETAQEPANAIETLDELLRTSVELRMRADVPVGGYLSGGLDSSVTCTLAAARSPFALRTFSITFEDPALDESTHQRAVAKAIGSRHVVQRIGAGEIASVFPDVVRHAESPILRTAPAPMFLLARLARDRGIKVVLTGEGSDELFLGYDLFKETLVRRFCLRQPSSTGRARLFDRLYPYMRTGGGELWQRFFLEAGDPADPLFSHQPRFRGARFLHAFFEPVVRDSIVNADVQSRLRDALPAEFARWSPMARASWLDITTLLQGYLLSSQGDRMAMAHGVEGRFPFLDHRLFAFAASLPAPSKLQGLKEKQILRRWARDIVPPSVLERTKQPYRAPDAPAFFGKTAPEYATELLEARAVRNTGFFAPDAVEALARRCRAGSATSVRENQALVAILSTQLWHAEFLGQRRMPTPLSPDHANVLVGQSVPVKTRAG